MAIFLWGKNMFFVTLPFCSLSWSQETWKEQRGQRTKAVYPTYQFKRAISVAKSDFSLINCYFMPKQSILNETPKQLKALEEMVHSYHK